MLVLVQPVSRIIRLGFGSTCTVGFFGFPTLGYYISASFENLHYGEVWTYLYTLFALVDGTTALPLATAQVAPAPAVQVQVAPVSAAGMVSVTTRRSSAHTRSSAGCPLTTR